MSYFAGKAVSGFIRTPVIVVALAFGFILADHALADGKTNTTVDVVVIVHPSNHAPIDQVTVKKIFTGKSNTFPDGTRAIPIELKQGEVRQQFLQKILKKTESALNSLWARRVFIGKGVPPKAYDTEEEIKKLVASNPGMIGFIDRQHVDDSIRVVPIK